MVSPGMPLAFVCPKCKQSLRSDDSALHCAECDRAYPVIDGIPDFLAGDAQDAALSRIARGADILARWYESPLWYQFTLRMSGARSTSLASIAQFHAESLRGVTGPVLDVACGPATYTRRLAAADRTMYGIDVSLGMLRAGSRLIARHRVPGVHLAPARVERLPFADESFNGAVCSGSLHLFPDTIGSLREIARTMEPGTPLTVQTFIAGNKPVGSLLRVFRIDRQVHRFELPELEEAFKAGGFEGLEVRMDGTVALFRTRKAGGGEE